MGTFARGLVGLGFLLAVIFAPSNAKAASPSALPASALQVLPVSAPLDAALQILEGHVLNRYLALPDSVNLGGCVAQVINGFPTIEMRFTRTTTCKMNGYIRFGLLPITANVRLELFDTAMLQAVDGDFLMQLTRPAKGSIRLRWHLLNGRVAFRLDPNAPIQERALSGGGERNRVGNNVVADARFNFFDPATTAGFALTRHVERGTRSVREVQRCLLIGANSADLNSGTLIDCVPVFGK